MHRFFLLLFHIPLLYAVGYPGKVQFYNFLDTNITIWDQGSLCLDQSLPSPITLQPEQSAQYPIMSNAELLRGCVYPAWGIQKLSIQTAKGGIATIKLAVRCRSLLDCGNGEATRQVLCLDTQNVLVDVTPHNFTHPFNQRAARFTITVAPALKGQENLCSDTDQPIYSWPRELNEPCAVHTDCKGWGAGTYDNACCQGQCLQKKADWTGIVGYCPHECKGSVFGDPGSCR